MRLWLVVLLSLLGLIHPATATQPATRLHPPQPTFAITSYVLGGQAELDQGLIIQVNHCVPNTGCPAWLAGHRTTHGSVFGPVAYLAPGDTVTVLGVWYIVQSSTIICCYHSYFVPTADLTLQTSATGTQVFIVTAHRL